MSSQGFTVGYWSIRGLCAPLRMMVMFRNVPLTANLYDCFENEAGEFDRSAWAKEKPALKARNPLMNLPYVIDNETGVVVTQSNACMSFLGRKLDLWGKSEADVIMCEQLLCEAMDIRNTTIAFAYGRSNLSVEEFLKNVMNPGGSFDKLNSILELKYAGRDAHSTDPVFFVGNSATAPDFHIWEMMDQIIGISDFYNKECPFTGTKLSAFHMGFRALPENQRYLSSQLYTLPANNISAMVYGATPSGGKWEMGEQDHFWKGRSGVY